MLPTSNKRKRFVPPLKVGDDSQDTLEQCSQFTQTQASSVDISLFSCPLARGEGRALKSQSTRNKADDRIVFPNSQASSFSDEGMNDTLEINNTPLLEKDHNTALLPTNHVYHDPTTQWHHMTSSADYHEEKQSQYQKRPRTTSAYKFTVGQKTIIKRSSTMNTNRKQPNRLSHTTTTTSTSNNSRGYQPSLSSSSTSMGVFDFPVSQDPIKGDMPTHKRDKSHDRSCDHSRRSSDTTLTNRNKREQMLIDAEVLSIILQTRKDTETIRKQHLENVRNEKLVADLNSLLRKEKLTKPLSFFISGHEE